MSEAVNIPDLERITFFAGQHLTAADLAELQRAHRELRWLHNRSLHGWGIGLGLDVMGERGDTAIIVQPGYGVDCLGREIILTEPQTKSIPATAAGPARGASVFYLVAAYQGDEEQRVAEKRPGVCLPEGTVRLSEEPRIDWRRPEQLQEGLELVLAQVQIQNCCLSQPPSPAPRRYARPPQQPYLSAGQAQVVGTDLEIVWQGEELAIAQMEVDTGAAGFSLTPHYTAHITGHRYLAEAPGPLIVFDHLAITDVAPRRFTLQIALRVVWPIESEAEGAMPPVGSIVDGLGWRVVWMGIEG